MKFFTPYKNPFLFAAFAFVALFYSCDKTETPTSTEEFIHSTINGTPYNFDMTTDSVFVDSLLETAYFLNGGNIYGTRVPGNGSDLTKITYNKAFIAQGSLQPLSSFYTPQTGIYPQFTTAATAPMITITEYGLVNQYIAGNFTALFIGPAPTNTQYNVSCSFRVRRRL
ncbi:MAG: hypothetical protein RIS73_1901 [Bacteroidota bacterium]